MPDKDKVPDVEDIPTLEELQESLGHEKMGFISEMLSEPGDESKD